MSGVDKFAEELKEMGFDPEVDGNRVSIDYVIPCGRFNGEKLKMGFEVNGFPANAPHGPHFSKHLMPMKQRGIHTSNFGQGWQHWSRPHNDWNKTDRKVKNYFSFLRMLFNNI